MAGASQEHTIHFILAQKKTLPVMLKALDEKQAK
jgi:hypothetical protein